MAKDNTEEVDVTSEIDFSEFSIVDTLDNFIVPTGEELIKDQEPILDEDEEEDEDGDEDPTPAPTPDEDEDGDEEPDGDEDSEEDEESSLTDFANFLREEGVLEFEEDAEFNDVEDLQKTIESTINKGVDEYKQGLPDVVKNFVEYVEAGGDPEEFLEMYQEPDYSKIDISSEDNQRRIIKSYLKAQGVDDDEIESDLEDYEDADKLEAMAKRFKNRLAKEQLASREQSVQDRKAQSEAVQEQQQQFFQSLKSSIDTADNIAGLPIKKTEKQDFYDYITKVDKKTGKTRYQSDMETDPVNDARNLAYIRYKQYNFDDIKKKTETEVTSKLRKKLSNFNSTGQSKKKGSQPKSTKPDLKNFRLF